MQSPNTMDTSPNNGFLSLNGFEKLGLSPFYTTFSFLTEYSFWHLFLP